VRDKSADDGAEALLARDVATTLLVAMVSATRAM
jgi:hypothetical protein